MFIIEKLFYILKKFINILKTRKINRKQPIFLFSYILSFFLLILLFIFLITLYKKRINNNFNYFLSYFFQPDQNTINKRRKYKLRQKNNTVKRIIQMELNPMELDNSSDDDIDTNDILNNEKSLKDAQHITAATILRMVFLINEDLQDFKKNISYIHKDLSNEIKKLREHIYISNNNNNNSNSMIYINKHSSEMNFNIKNDN